jgi:hypothetical protein
MPAQYQYANNGLSYAEFSFFDVLMPQLLSMTREIIKRLNILFINPSNLAQTTIRTFPATNNFSISNTDTFQELLNDNSQGQILISLPYNDPYTSTGELLMYLGTIIPVNSTLTLVLQIELDIDMMERFFYKRVVYFPNAIVGYIYTDPSNN